MPHVLGLISFRVFPTHMGGQKGVAVFYSHLNKLLPVSLALSFDNRKEDTLSTHAVLYPNRSMYRNLGRLNQLKQIMKIEGTGIILAEHSYTGWIAWLLRRSTGVPYIIHSHNIESRRFQKMGHWWWRSYLAYEGWIHRKADHNFFISEEDLQFALTSFRLDKSKCSVVTYGIDKPVLHQNRNELKKSLGLNPSMKIFLFNGTLDYVPNFHAVEALIDHIEPLLYKEGLSFHIVITGNRAPVRLLRKMQHARNVTFTGYVPDVNLYYQAADLFLNPVANDTGVKTKLIEAIANNCTAISTEAGAMGIRRSLCGAKLVTVKEGDWKAFGAAVLKQITTDNVDTPSGFYDYYEWKNIARVAADKINELVAP